MFQVELPCNKVPNGFSPFSGTPKPASRWWYMYIFVYIYPIKYPILDPPPDFMPIKYKCVHHIMFIWKSASTSSGFWNFSSFSPWKSPKIAPFPQPSACFPPLFPGALGTSLVSPLVRIHLVDAATGYRWGKPAGQQCVFNEKASRHVARGMGCWGGHGPWKMRILLVSCEITCGKSLGKSPFF